MISSYERILHLFTSSQTCDEAPFIGIKVHCCDLLSFVRVVEAEAKFSRRYVPH